MTAQEIYEANEIWLCSECCEYFTEPIGQERCPFCGSHQITPMSEEEVIL